MTLSRKMLIAATVFALLVVTGCGGDSRRGSQQSVRQASSNTTPSGSNFQSGSGPIVPARVTDPARRARLRRQHRPRGDRAERHRGDQAAHASEDTTRVQALQQQLDALTHSLVGFARGYGFSVCGAD